MPILARILSARFVCTLDSWSRADQPSRRTHARQGNHGHGAYVAVEDPGKVKWFEQITELAIVNSYMSEGFFSLAHAFSFRLQVEASRNRAIWFLFQHWVWSKMELVA